MNSSRFITGIFNYCDYWCERCAFTQRCRNFAMGKEEEQEAAGASDATDATCKAFWNKLASKLRETAVVGEAEEWRDADLPEPEPDMDIESEAREEARRKTVQIHPLVVLAQTYLEKSSAWLKTSDDDLKQVAEGLLQSARSPFGGGDAEEQAREIGDLIEIVTWYHTLIPPKLARAVSGLTEVNLAGDEVGRILKASRREDANGTGKLALVSIERSLAAWIRLREIVPNQEDAILEMLSLLSQLQHGIHATLPGVKAFIRPGFDEAGSRNNR